MTGSRAWRDEDAVRKALNDVSLRAARVGDTLTVIHGACPTGADAFAADWCRQFTNGHVVEERHPAQWSEHGKAAGPIRNQEMVNAGADVVLAFPATHVPSRGTEDAVRRALKAGIPVNIIETGKLDGG